MIRTLEREPLHLLVIAGEPVSDVGDLRPVGRIEPLHDVTEVNFYGAHPHVQFKGNNLVWLSEAYSRDDFRLSRRETSWQAGLERRFCMSRYDAARRDKLTTRLNETKGFDRHVEGHARRNIAART